jgi:MoaA/NifB/PqqE/SkfB family radical SAM enzyme/SAM-dependent methyltransferase
MSDFNRLLKKNIGGLLRPFLGTAPGQAAVKFYHRRLQPAVRRFYPLFGVTVMVGLTYKCQCSCPHCGTTPYGDPGKPEFSEAEALDLIRQAAALGAGGAYLFGGEPLLFAGLADLVREARRLGLVVTLDTNGLLLDRSKAAELKAAGLDRVGVSLDSADEAEHDRLRGCPGSWRAAVAAMRHCKEEGIEVCLSTYATRESLAAGGLDRTIAVARSVGVKTRVMSPLRAGKWSGRPDVPFGPEEIKQLRSRLAPDVYWESLFTAAPSSSFHCGCSARTHFYVSPYGEVQPCCYIPLDYGSVRREPLKTIVGRMWGSRVFSAMGPGSDCPMNSEKFRASLAAEAPGAGPGPHPAGLCSPNDPAEWDDWAPHYGADVDWVEEIHNPDIRELASPDGRRVLDLGCGTGRRARAVFAGAARLVAVDSSRGMAAVAREELKGLERAEVLELDIEKDELPAGPFDAAVAVSTMHHIRDAGRALAKVKERLAPGGVLVIVDALKGNPPLTALKYYLEMLRLHNPLRLALGFARAFFLDTRVARHKAREVHLTFGEFCRRYAGALPGARTEVRHGLFGYLVWRKPE